MLDAVHLDVPILDLESFRESGKRLPALARLARLRLPRSRRSRATRRTGVRRAGNDLSSGASTLTHAKPRASASVSIRFSSTVFPTPRNPWRIKLRAARPARILSSAIAARSIRSSRPASFGRWRSSAGRVRVPARIHVRGFIGNLGILSLEAKIVSVPYNSKFATAKRSRALGRNCD